MLTKVAAFASLSAATVQGASTEANPIRRVVTLMQDMQKELESEGAKEDDLFKAQRMMFQQEQAEVREDREHEMLEAVDAIDPAVEENSLTLTQLITTRKICLSPSLFNRYVMNLMRTETAEISDNKLIIRTNSKTDWMEFEPYIFTPNF